MQRILTTHTGSLPRPPEILAAFADGGPSEELLAGAVRDVVRRQTDTGLDVVGDGEFGKPTDTTNDADHGHGVWALYVRERLTGFEWVEGEKASPSSKDRTAFPAFYGSGGRRQPAEGGRAGEVGTTAQVFTCTGPIAYCGSELVARDIAHLQAALDGADAGRRLPPGGLPRVAAVAHPRPPPRRRGRLPTGARRRAARGVPRDRRGRPDAADRRSGARRSLGLLARRRPRRLPRRRPARRRAAQRGAARDPDRADPLPPLLGQLAGPAPLRPAARRRRRPHARDPRRRVPRRGRQRAARARVEALARHRAARRRDAHPRRRLAQDERRGAPRGRGRPDRALRGRRRARARHGRDRLRAGRADLVRRRVGEARRRSWRARDWRATDWGPDDRPHPHHAHRKPPPAARPRRGARPRGRRRRRRRDAGADAAGGRRRRRGAPGRRRGRRRERRRAEQGRLLDLRDGAPHRLRRPGHAAARAAGRDRLPRVGRAAHGRHRGDARDARLHRRRRLRARPPSSSATSRTCAARCDAHPGAEAS